MTVPSSSSLSFETDDGRSATFSNGIVNISGLLTQGIMTASSGNTINLRLLSASQTQTGVLSLAGVSAALDGTDTTTAICPATLSAKLGAQTTGSVALGAGFNQPLNWSAPLASGQLLIGTSGSPVPGYLSAGTGIAINSQAGSIIISATGALPSFVTDNGAAAAIGSTFKISGGRGIKTSAVGNTITLQLEAVPAPTPTVTPTPAPATPAPAPQAALTGGQILIGTTVNSPPVPGYITGGAGIAITHSPGTIVISATGTFPSWQSISSNLTLSPNKNYFIASGALTLSLPTSAPIGAAIGLILTTGSSWTLQGPAVIYGSKSGTLSTNAPGTSVRLVCYDPSQSLWIVEYAVGTVNIT